MKCKETAYVGIEITWGPRPLIYAVLDPDLNVKVLERYSVSKVMRHLQSNENVMLAINVSFRNSTASNGNGQKVFNTVEKEIAQTGFKPYLSNHACRQWVETYPLECFGALTEQTLLPRRSIRGRVQRAAILYEHGMQINNPGDDHLNTDATRATLYTPSELDALIAAGIAWMLVNRPVKIDLTRKPNQQMISIPREDKDWWRKKPVVQE